MYNFINTKYARKVSWKLNEDEILRKWVFDNGPKNWGSAADLLPNRSSKQCRDRWMYVLQPNIKKGKWTEEEDTKLFVLFTKYRCSWSRIAREMEGRTENCIKNRIYHTLKKIRETYQKPKFSKKMFKLEELIKKSFTLQQIEILLSGRNQKNFILDKNLTDLKNLSKDIVKIENQSQNQIYQDNKLNSQDLYNLLGKRKFEEDSEETQYTYKYIENLTEKMQMTPIKCLSEPGATNELIKKLRNMSEIFSNMLCQIEIRRASVQRIIDNLNFQQIYEQNDETQSQGSISVDDLVQKSDIYCDNAIDYLENYSGYKL